MTQQLLAGLDEDTLHGAPPVVLVGGAHAVHLTLAADGVAVLLACHAQEDVGAHMSEAYSLITLPVDAITLHHPQVQIVTLAVLSKGADLLKMTPTGGGKQKDLFSGDSSGKQIDLLAVTGVKTLLCSALPLL